MEDDGGILGMLGEGGGIPALRHAVTSLMRISCHTARSPETHVHASAFGTAAEELMEGIAGIRLTCVGPEQHEILGVFCTTLRHFKRVY